MKLPFRKNKEFLSALYDILGFYPHNIELYRVAFSHKSLGYRKDGGSSAGSFKDRKDRKGGPAQRDADKIANRVLIRLYVRSTTNV